MYFRFESSAIPSMHLIATTRRFRNVRSGLETPFGALFRPHCDQTVAHVALYRSGVTLGRRSHAAAAG